MTNIYRHHVFPLQDLLVKWHVKGHVGWPRMPRCPRLHMHLGSLQWPPGKISLHVKMNLPMHVFYIHLHYYCWMYQEASCILYDGFLVICYCSLLISDNFQRKPSWSLWQWPTICWYLGWHTYLRNGACSQMTVAFHCSDCWHIADLTQTLWSWVVSVVAKYWHWRHRYAHQLLICSLQYPRKKIRMRNLTCKVYNSQTTQANRNVLSR